MGDKANIVFGGQWVRFVVPGEARGLARHRTRVVQAQSGRAFAQTYDPKQNREEKGAVAHVARLAMQKRDLSLMEGPLSVTMQFYLLRPKSKQVARPERTSPERLVEKCFPTTKPDLDNLEKLVLDACSQVVFRDDSQVCEVRKAKEYVDSDPRTVVLVRRMGLWEAGEVCPEMYRKGVQHEAGVA